MKSQKSILITLCMLGLGFSPVSLAAGSSRHKQKCSANEEAVKRGNRTECVPRTSRNDTNSDTNTSGSQPESPTNSGADTRSNTGRGNTTGTGTGQGTGSGSNTTTPSPTPQGSSGTPQ